MISTISDDPSPKLWWLIEDKTTVLAVSAKQNRTVGFERSFLNNNQDGHSYKVEQLTEQEVANHFGLSIQKMQAVLNLDTELLY